ncbi:MAG: TonB-dependent receptor plug domain-containing protein [Prevotella sp.]
MYKTNSNRREVLRFKQFSSKGYALFACLGREVLICTLSVATLSHAKADGVSVEPLRKDTLTTKTARELTLDEVCVTGSRAPLTRSQAARMVTVLERSDIAQAPVQSVNDLLKYVAGVDVRQRGPIGAQTDISVRGGTNEQITILLNGINICDPQAGHNAFDFPVDISEIERIEVLEGPAGRVYGTSSLVGAINIVTRPDRQSGVGVRAEGGSYGYASGGAKANMTTGRWSNQLSGSYARSDGYTRSKTGSLNTDFSGSKAFYQGRYEDKDVSVNWYAGLSDKGWGSSTFYATPKWQADDQYEHTTKIYTAVQAETKNGAFHFKPSIYWNHHQDRYEGYRDQPEKLKYNYNRTDVYGVNLNSFFDWVGGRTAFGAELRNEDLVSGNLGEPLSRVHHIGGTDRDYTLGINRSNISAYLEHNILMKRFTLSAGLIAVKNSWNEMNFTVYPGIDASYRVGEAWKVYASYNTSLRMPSFTEMYYKLQGYSANPYLKPEEMQAVEVGVKFASHGIEAKLSGYHHHGKNMIDWIMDMSMGDNAVWESVNHTKINSLGVEAAFVLDMKTLLPCQSVLRRLNVSYSYIDQDKDLEDNIVSQYALEYLRHKLVAGLQLNIWSKLNMCVNFRWQDRIGTYTDFDMNVRDYQPYGVFDARMSWEADSYRLYVEANNIFDKDYRDYGNVKQPGTWIIAGAAFNVNF